MLNYLCCTKGSEVPWESLLDVAPKKRSSFQHDRPRKISGLRLGRNRSRGKAFVQPTLRKQSELTEESQSTARNTLTSSQNKYLQPGPTDHPDKYNIIRRLAQRNLELKSLLRGELQPLEQQYLNLFVENRRKGDLIDLLSRRLYAIADAQYNFSDGNLQ